VKPFSIVALIIGVAVSVVIVVSYGVHEIVGAFLRLGASGFILLCLAHAAVVAVMGLAWRFCLPKWSAVRTPGVIAARMLREAGAEVLPLSELGGYVLGARAAVLAGATSLEAAASTLVDLTTEAAAQLGFVALGLAALYQLRPDAPLLRPTAVVVAILIGVVAFAALYFERSVKFVAPARAAIRRWFVLFGDTERAFAIMGAITHQRGAVTAAFLLHLVGWLGIAGEAWLALRLLGAPIPYPSALILESLLYAARSLGFFAPNAVGVQEGAYALLAPLVGLNVTEALALSLVKRARDIVIGAPTLLLWQRAEAARLLRRRR
jgi:glycosyltransferase 2 family protein